MSSVLFSSTFSEAGTESSAPINHPEVPPVTRANTVAGSVTGHAEELVFQHIGSKLRHLSVSSRLTTLTDDGTCTHSSYSRFRSHLLTLTGASSPLKSEDSATTEYVPEHSFWGDDAENSVRIGLARLAQYADDLHKWAPEKSIEEHYSQRLAELINECGVKFDPKYLK